VGQKRHTYVYATIGSKQTSLTLVTLMKYSQHLLVFIDQS